MNGLRRNRLFAGIALLLLVCMGFAFLFSARGEARGSSLSRGPNGWLAARKYLEARGSRLALLDAPLEDPRGEGVLVTTFPWQQGASVEAAEALENHLRRGGDMVLGYSGIAGNPGETVVMERLGLPVSEVRKVTLNPVRWRAAALAEWRLRPEGAARGSAPVRVWAPRSAPMIPPRAEVLFRSPEGKPVIALLRRSRGRILLLPSDALSNGRLGEPGNAGLLETLRVRLGDRWTFDEYHHGLTGAQAVETAAAFGRALDLVLLHLAALYLVALWTLSRRFGPAWSEPPTVTGSAGAFLLGLGALHHRLGHHAQAALRLLERVRELDRDLELPAELDRRAAAAGPRELVALAREVARRRARRPPETPPADIERETAA